MQRTYVVVILPPVNQERLDRLLEELKDRLAARCQDAAAPQPEAREFE